MPFLRWFKRWFLDGWLTTGPQIGVTAHVNLLAFACCLMCHRVIPHWEFSMLAAEARKRGYIGCKCGCLRLAPTIIPSYKAMWFYWVRGVVIRKWLLRSRLWDPRMPVLFNEPGKAE